MQASCFIFDVARYKTNSTLEKDTFWWYICSKLQSKYLYHLAVVVCGEKDVLVSCLRFYDQIFHLFPDAIN